MLAFRSIRMWKNICEALHDETTALKQNRGGGFYDASCHMTSRDVK